jgi:hypothetical protein
MEAVSLPKTLINTFSNTWAYKPRSSISEHCKEDALGLYTDNEYTGGFTFHCSKAVTNLRELPKM